VSSNLTASAILASTLIQDSPRNTATKQFFKKFNSVKIRKLYDGQGLYLWVYEDGRKYWRLRYKIHDKEKSLSLGVYPVVGLKQARQLAQAERAKLTENIDPSTDPQAEQAESKGSHIQ
jgi:hypothetical protein